MAEDLEDEMLRRAMEMSLAANQEDESLRIALEQSKAEEDARKAKALKAEEDARKAQELSKLTFAKEEEARKRRILEEEMQMSQLLSKELDERIRLQMSGGPPPLLTREDSGKLLQRLGTLNKLIEEDEKQKAERIIEAHKNVPEAEIARAKIEASIEQRKDVPTNKATVQFSPDCLELAPRCLNTCTGGK